MSLIPASTARTIAASALTQEELDRKYSSVSSEIQGAAQTRRRFFLDVSVGSDFRAELANWLNLQGYVAEPSPESVTVGVPASAFPDGDLSLVRVRWGSVSIQDQPLTIERNTVITYNLSTLGYANGSVLRWRQVGTAPADNFGGSALTGTITVNSNSATLSRTVLPEAVAGNTVRIEFYVELVGIVQRVAISNEITIA
jgi:hypothetical protein